MKIAIDGRFYGLQHAGLGRYAMNLIHGLSDLDRENEYEIFLTKETQLVKALSQNFKIIRVNIPHYSIKEQLLLPFLIWRGGYDFVHFPHYNVPLLNLTTPFIVTIFDLIKHHYPADQAKNTSFWKSKFKMLAYKLDMWWAVKKSAVVITGVKAVRSEIILKYHTDPAKVVAIPLGVDRLLVGDHKQDATEKLTKYAITAPYFIYVGNGYAYKNVGLLLQALKALPDEFKLVLVGARSVFQEGLRKMIDDLELSDRVVMAGYVPDDELEVLYQNAVCFVSASLIEGFGLPPLEAMQSNCPVILSNIPVHREVCRDGAIYFDLDKVDNLVDSIQKIKLDQALRDEMIKLGKSVVSDYSWEKMAHQTLNVYQDVLVRIRPN